MDIRPDSATVRRNGELINISDVYKRQDLRDEIEKDVWELKNLDLKIRSNTIYNVKTLDFRKIYQPDIREECKKAVYMNLQYEAIGLSLIHI